MLLKFKRTLLLPYKHAKKYSSVYNGLFAKNTDYRVFFLGGLCAREGTSKAAYKKTMMHENTTRCKSNLLQ